MGLVDVFSSFSENKKVSPYSTFNCRANQILLRTSHFFNSHSRYIFLDDFDICGRWNSSWIPRKHIYAHNAWLFSILHHFPKNRLPTRRFENFVKISHFILYVFYCFLPFNCSRGRSEVCLSVNYPELSTICRKPLNCRG